MDKRRGFTLLELLLVMFIVGVLVTGIVATFGPAARVRAYQATIDQNLGVIRIAVMGYFQENGVYPGSIQDLRSSGYLENTFGVSNAGGVTYSTTSGAVTGIRTATPYSGGSVTIDNAGNRVVNGW